MAFHGQAGHVPASARRWSDAGEGEFGYYTFQDFFHRGPGDADVAGVRIQWEFSGATPISISKQSDKWMRYERRPPRPVEFLGLSRALPAIELPTLRSHFGLTATPVVAPQSNASRGHLERVLGRTYPSAEVLNGNRYKIRRSGREGGYTSFNMGTGEDALIGLLARLESVPAGSLVVIEELETGLHPAAQKRVAQAIIEIAWSRKLQIVGSTHSHHVLDQLPRQARMLLIREGESHRVVKSPSAMFALSEMAETSEHELLILCEDEFAASLISQMLPKQRCVAAYQSKAAERRVNSLCRRKAICA
ncbi:MAG: AAA family ATPase [Ramlibacter sp.]